MSYRFDELTQTFDFIGKSDVLFSANEMIHTESKIVKLILQKG